MIKNEIKNIVVLARTAWGSPVKGRAHHLALEFSQASSVLYIDPLPFVDLVHGFFSKKPVKFRTNKVNKNLTVLYFPEIKRIRSKLSTSAINTAQIFFIKQVIKKFKLKNYVLWIASPFYSGVVKNIGEGISCYLCSDKFSKIVDSPDLAKALSGMEKELLRKVDLVFASSKALYKDCRKYNKNTFLVYNAVSQSYFEDSSGMPKDMEKIRKPILGFVGTISKFLDIKLIRHIARYNKDWSVVLIGPLRNNVKLQGEDNLILLGEKKYEDLSRYVKYFDVGILPYKNIPEIEYFDFGKVYQYLACGKPIVTSYIPEIRKFGSLCRISINQNEFIKNIKKALGEGSDEELIKRRRVFALSNTWRKRAEEIAEIICRRYQ